LADNGRSAASRKACRNMGVSRKMMFTIPAVRFRTEAAA
jgi:hypothetical protein